MLELWPSSNQVRCEMASWPRFSFFTSQTGSADGTPVRTLPRAARKSSLDKLLRAAPSLHKSPAEGLGTLEGRRSCLTSDPVRFETSILERFPVDLDHGAKFPALFAPDPRIKTPALPPVQSD